MRRCRRCTKGANTSAERALLLLLLLLLGSAYDAALLVPMALLAAVKSLFLFFHPLPFLPLMFLLIPPV
jgi:hypothetical protein